MLTMVFNGQKHNVVDLQHAKDKANKTLHMKVGEYFTFEGKDYIKHLYLKICGSCRRVLRSRTTIGSNPRTEIKEYVNNGPCCALCSDFHELKLFPHLKNVKELCFAHGIKENEMIDSLTGTLGKIVFSDWVEWNGIRVSAYPEVVKYHWEKGFEPFFINDTKPLKEYIREWFEASTRPDNMVGTPSHDYLWIDDQEKHEREDHEFDKHLLTSDEFIEYERESLAGAQEGDKEIKDRLLREWHEENGTLNSELDRHLDELEQEAALDALEMDGYDPEM